jgi:hypothetical protein
MGSLADGMADGAKLYLGFKRDAREDRYRDQQIQESKAREQRATLQAKREDDTRKIMAANQRLQSLVTKRDNAVQQANGDKEMLRAIDDLYGPKILQVTDLYKGIEGDAAMRKGDRNYVGGKTGADGRFHPMVRNNESGTVGLATENGKPLGEGGLPKSFENMQEVIDRVSSHGGQLAAEAGVEWTAITNPAMDRKVKKQQARDTVDNLTTIAKRNSASKGLPETREKMGRGPQPTTNAGSMAASTPEEELGAERSRMGQAPRVMSPAVGVEPTAPAPTAPAPTAPTPPASAPAVFTGGRTNSITGLPIGTRGQGRSVLTPEQSETLKQAVDTYGEVSSGAEPAPAPTAKEEAVAVKEETAARNRAKLEDTREAKGLSTASDKAGGPEAVIPREEAAVAVAGMLKGRQDLSPAVKSALADMLATETLTGDQVFEIIQNKPGKGNFSITNGWLLDKDSGAYKYIGEPKSREEVQAAAEKSRDRAAANFEKALKLHGGAPKSWPDMGADLMNMMSVANLNAAGIPEEMVTSVQGQTMIIEEAKATWEQNKNAESWTGAFTGVLRTSLPARLVGKMYGMSASEVSVKAKRLQAHATKNMGIQSLPAGVYANAVGLAKDFKWSEADLLDEYNKINKQLAGATVPEAAKWNAVLRTLGEFE